MSAMPPYSESGYDSDEQEAIMEATAPATCALCGKEFKSARALRIHTGRAHGPKDEPGGSGSSARKSLRSLSQGGPPTNGSVDQLVHELALALLDQALDELRAKVRAAL